MSRSQSMVEGGENEEDHLHNIRKSISAFGSTENKDNAVTQDFIIDSMWFQILVNAMTLVNTVQMGVEADHPEWTGLWAVSENIFTAGFAMEMVVKLIVLRWRYFHDRANWLDGSLTCLGILDCWVFALIGGGADLQSLSILRILRLMRLARILKLVRNFKPFVLVIQGVLGAISTTCYVFALLMIILYVFAIFFVQYLGHGNTDLYPGYSTDMEVIDEQELMANYNPYLCFGNIPFAMLTLFNMAMMAEWSEIVKPIAVKQPIYVVVFVGFALLVAFSVMNVMIGSIVDSVFTESKDLEKAFKDEVMKEKLANLEKVQQLLLDMDTNKDGEVDIGELTNAMKTNEQFQSVLRSIHLPSGWSATELLDMLDNNGDGMLQKAEFTTSFFRLMESDDFQQICILQASINQVKHSTRVLSNTFAQSFSELQKNFKDQFSVFERELSSMKTACFAMREECSLRERQDPVMQEVTLEKATSEPCSEPVGEPHPKSCKENLSAAEITQAELAQCADGACDELRERIQCIAHKQLRETLDAIQESFQKEIGMMKPTLEPKLITSGQDGQTLRQAPSSHVGFPVHPDPSASNLGQGVRSIPDAVHTYLNSVQQQSDLDGGDFESVVSANHAGEMFDPPEEDPAASMDSAVPCPQKPGAASDIARQPADSVNAPTECTPSCPAGVTTSNAGDSRSSVPADQTNNHVDGPPNADAHPNDISLQFTFEEGSPQLGFELFWYPEGLPRVGRVMPHGAADVRGMLQGDRLVQCNGISVAGQERDVVLKMLRVRPLVLKIGRTDAL